MHNCGLLVLLGIATLLAGCSTRSLYDGIQQQESVRNPPTAGQAAQRRPSYDEYETERRK